MTAVEKGMSIVAGKGPICKGEHLRMEQSRMRRCCYATTEDAPKWRETARDRQSID